jgi:hypothetical protein
MIISVAYLLIRCLLGCLAVLTRRRSARRDGQREPAAVGQDVNLRAGLARSTGLGPVMAPIAPT